MFYLTRTALVVLAIFNKPSQARQLSREQQRHKVFNIHTE